MKGIVVIIVMIAMVLSVASIDLAYAGWKENYREKYSKKNVDPNSAEGKKIRTLANMDFTYPEWKEPSHGGKPKKESTDKFEGASANYGPGNVGGLEAAVSGKTTGYTLTGIVKDVGGAFGKTGSAALEVKRNITSEKEESSTK